MSFRRSKAKGSRPIRSSRESKRRISSNLRHRNLPSSVKRINKNLKESLLGEKKSMRHTKSSNKRPRWNLTQRLRRTRNSENSSRCHKIKMLSKIWMKKCLKQQPREWRCDRQSFTHSLTNSSILWTLRALVAVCTASIPQQDLLTRYKAAYKHVDRELQSVEISHTTYKKIPNNP